MINAAYNKYYQELLYNIKNIPQDINLQSRSISCLENLGLVRVYEDTYFYGKNANAYKKYYETDFYIQECENVKQIEKDAECVVYETYVEITPVGVDLLKVCLNYESEDCVECVGNC